jgi:Ser/Thr protein kinase RdoA (MazF antagonist)
VPVIADLASRWQADPETLTLVSHGGNQVFRCTSPGGPLYIRVTTSAVRRPSLIAGAVDWHRQLHAAGAPVVEPLVSLNGCWIEASGGTTFATATRAARGRPVEFGSRAEVSSWAEAVARVHTASEGYVPAPVSTSRGPMDGELPALLDLWREIEPVVTSDPALREQYTARSLDLARCSEPLSITHGDVRPENAVISDGRVILIDFDEPTRAWAAYDLARMMLDDDACPPADRDRHRSAILDGYRRARPRAAIEDSDIERFLGIRILLMYGWSVLDPAGVTEKWLRQLRSLF